MGWKLASSKYARHEKTPTGGPKYFDPTNYHMNSSIHIIHMRANLYFIILFTLTSRHTVHCYWIEWCLEIGKIRNKIAQGKQCHAMTVLFKDTIYNDQQVAQPDLHVHILFCKNKCDQNNFSHMGNRTHDLGTNRLAHRSITL